MFHCQKPELTYIFYYKLLGNNFFDFIMYKKDFCFLTVINVKIKVL